MAHDDQAAVETPDADAAGPGSGLHHHSVGSQATDLPAPDLMQAAVGSEIGAEKRHVPLLIGAEPQRIESAVAIHGLRPGQRWRCLERIVSNGRLGLRRGASYWLSQRRLIDGAASQEQSHHQERHQPHERAQRGQHPVGRSRRRIQAEL
jgi:hypothetical protein